MKISGFTILRQTVRLGYPFTESIRSLLPLVDELIIGVGDGEDGTWEAVQAIGDAKITAFRSPWDLSLRIWGRVLSEQTNLALNRCSGEWAVYLQADEVLHEDDLEHIHAAMHYHRHRRTEGLLFHYLHFYGSYHTVGDDWHRWYPRAVRAVKTGIGVESLGDACGFHLRRDGYTRGLLKADSGGRVFHYGWCGPPALIQEKEKNLQRFYHDDAWIEQYHQSHAHRPIFARYQGALKTFTGTHPQAMRPRVVAQDWTFDSQIERQWPAWLRAVGIILASPFVGGRNNIRPLVPVILSNSGWRALDLWRALIGKLKGWVSAEKR